MTKNLIYKLMSLLGILLSVTSFSSQAASSGLQGGRIAIYDGGFGCPADFENNSDWINWFSTDEQRNFFPVDLLPPVQILNPMDLCPPRPDAQDKNKKPLFSSQNQKVVESHFLWMKQHSIDVVAYQRMVVDLETPAKKRRSDHVVQNILMAATKYNMSFFIIYNIDGANPDTFIKTIQEDWAYLTQEVSLPRSSFYLKDHGKPVLQLCGVGFNDRITKPDSTIALIHFLQHGSSKTDQVILIGGLPEEWRTLKGDSEIDPDWSEVYRSFDVISPWISVAMSDFEGNRIRDQIVLDRQEVKRNGLRYLPVLFQNAPENKRLIQKENLEPKKQYLIGCNPFLTKKTPNVSSASIFDLVNGIDIDFTNHLIQSKLEAGAGIVYVSPHSCEN